MEKVILFSERQRFNQWWLWLILLIICGIPFYVFINDVADLTLLVITSIILLLPIAIFIFLRLDTVIKEDGIYVRFFPFHIKFIFYSWGSIANLYIREYSPISEYGGWGIKIGSKSKGMAFNTSGNIGLQLEFFDKRKILIGTNRPKEMEEALKKMGL